MPHNPSTQLQGWLDMLTSGSSRGLLVLTLAMLAVAAPMEARSDEVLCHDLSPEVVRLERRVFPGGTAQFDVYFPAGQGSLSAESAELYFSLPAQPVCESCGRTELVSMISGRKDSGDGIQEGQSTFVVSFREPGVQGLRVTIYTQYTGVCTAMMKVTLDPSDPSTWPMSQD